MHGVVLSTTCTKAGRSVFGSSISSINDESSRCLKIRSSSQMKVDVRTDIRLSCVGGSTVVASGPRLRL
jgi:hypothetical protein